MKITNLECPSCGGKLKPMAGNPQIMICEYCGNQCMVEQDVTVNYHIHQPSSSVQPPDNKNNNAQHNSFPLLILAVLSIAGISLIILGSRPSSGSAPSVRIVNMEKNDMISNPYLMEEAEEERPAEYSALCENFLKTLFQKDISFITESDLEKIKYISVRTGMDISTVEYSFQSPYENPSFETETLTLPSLSWNSEDLSAFTGLQKIDISNENPGNIRFEKLTQLKGISCYGLTPEEIAGMLPSPEQILDLSLDSPGNMDGISAFENLEILSVEDISRPDLKQLIPLTHLKNLSIQEKEPDLFSESGKETSLTDYSPLSAMVGLEKLELASSSIRELSFLKPLKNLTDLSLAETEAISLEPLSEMEQLISLHLRENNSFRDYTPLERLANLQTLVLDKSTSQPDPVLSSLRRLENLDMCGFLSIAFLNGMDNLKHLSIHSCNVDEISSLSGLTGLESFSCYSVWTYAVPLRDVRFIDGMTNLKSLDFSGVNEDDEWGVYQHYTEILGDISNVFNHHGLEKLVLNNCMFAIDFGNLSENPSLKHLEMKEISLKENFYVEASPGMMDIWYDDVSLDEHLDFLSNYPGLEKLYLDGNQITDIQFAASLSNLTHFSLKNNYVTELTPLNRLEFLQFLDIRTNPITSTIEAGDSIQILK